MRALLTLKLFQWCKKHQSNGHQSTPIKEWWWFWHNQYCSPCETAITTFYYSYLPAKLAECNYSSKPNQSHLSQILTKWTAAMGNSHGLKILKLYHNSIAGLSSFSNFYLGFVSYTKYFCSETLLLSKEVTSFEVLSCSITEKWKKISLKSNLQPYYFSI